MIVEVNKDQLSSFLQFMTEADNDPPRKNMKVLNLRVSDKRRPDFTAGADASADEEGEEPAEANAEPAADAGAEEPVTDEGEDFTDGADTDDGEEATDTPEETSDEPAADAGAEEPVTDEGEDFTDGADAEGDGEGGEAGAEEPVTDEGEDFTDGADAEGDGEGGEAGDGEEPRDDTADSGDAGGEDSNVEKMYKYNLFIKFKKVLTVITTYVKDLEGIISDDAETNQKYKELTSKLSTIKDLMEDYMIMKFSKVSFMQSMLFYQRIITSVNIILDTIKRIQKSELKSKM